MMATIAARIKPYTSMFRIRVIAMMQYRAAAWAGIATQFFWGVMYIMVYKAFYDSAVTAPELPFEALVDYRWLEQAFLAIVMLWSQDMDLLQMIASGNVAYELCRPYDLYPLWFARLCAQRLGSALMRCGPILLVAVFLPEPYRLHLPPDVFALAGFAVAMTLSLLLAVALSMFVYIQTFVTLSPSGARLTLGMASEFLQGSVVPIPLMPMGLQHVLNVLPFRYTTDLPFRLWSGNIAGQEAIWGIGVQVVWLAVLVMLGGMAMRRVLGRAVIQGG